MKNRENNFIEAGVSLETVPGSEQGAEGRFITYEEAAELIGRSLASLRIYVVESDITEAQDSIRAIVEKATF